MRLRFMSVCLLGLAASVPVRAVAQQPFRLTLPGYADGASFSRAQAARAHGCGGENVSPALAWRDAPPATRSFAVVMYDPDGARGLGFDHWLLYGIPAGAGGLAAGAGSASGPYVGGANGPGTRGYFGPCPPRGDPPHHYVILAYALDLDPGALPPGLDRPSLFRALAGHVLAASSVVLRYGR